MPDRKRAARAAILLATISLTACAVPGTGGVAPASRVLAFDTEEFTEANVDVSPDGRTILFDVLGDLYTVPIEGGDARPLTSGRAWDVHPRFSPDGSRIGFVSDRGGGEATLWTVDAQGENGTGYESSNRGWVSGIRPAWTPDGALLDLRLTGGGPRSSLQKLAGPGRSVPFSDLNLDDGIYRGGFSPDGLYAYHGGESLRRVDLRSGESVDLQARGESGVLFFYILSVRVSRTGERLAYVAQSSRANIETCALHVRDLRTGEDRALADIEGCSASDYAFLPDDSAIIAALGGRLSRIDATSGARQVIPVRVHVRREVDPQLRQVGRRIADGGEVRTRVVRWPTLSRDGAELVFDAFGSVYAMRLPDGVPRRLTASADMEHAPALSPDGRSVVYSSSSDNALGHVMIVPVDGGAPRQLTIVPGRYLNPVWSPDGRRIAFIADETDARLGLMPPPAPGGGWTLSLQWVPVEGGAAHRVLPVRPTSSGPNNRFHPVPTFSPDGSRIFISRNPGTGNGPSAELVSVGVDGRDVASHLRLNVAEGGDGRAAAAEADEMVVSPDGRHVAIAFQGRAYIVSVVQAGSANVDLGALQSVATDMPTHLSWQDGETLIWAAGSQVRRHRLGATEPGLLADLDIHRPRPTPQGCFAMVDARLITMRADEVIEHGTMVVCGNRIVEVGPTESVAIPDGARRIDARGATIIPGLMDTHAHFHHAPLDAWLRQNPYYVGNLAFGVTTLFDPSAPALDAFGQAEMVEAGEMQGPRIFASGMPIYDSRRLTNSRLLRSLDEAREVVASYARYGAGPLKEYIQHRRDRRQWLAQAAREQGVSLTTHSDTWPSPLTNIVDGYTAIEHELGFSRPGRAPLRDDVLRFVAESGVTTSREGLSQLYWSTTNVDDPKLRRLYPASMLRTETDYTPPPSERDAIVRAARTARRLAELGGFVVISAHGNGIPGLALHQELWALVLAGGMNPHDALRAATFNGARKLNLETDLGSLEPGKVADFVVLNANPLENIRNSTDIRWVVRGGFLYDAPTMTRLWPDRRELLPWPWQSDEERRRLAPAVPPELPPGP